MTGDGRYLIHRGPDHMDHALKARVKIRPFRNISPGIGGVRYPVVYSVTPALNYVREKELKVIMTKIEEPVRVDLTTAPSSPHIFS